MEYAMPPTRKLTVHTSGDVFKRQELKSRRDRTLSLGPARLAAAQKAIRLLTQLANPQTHELRGEEPARLVTTLREEVNALEYALKNGGKASAPAGVFDTEE
jgi:hypothetical protein